MRKQGKSYFGSYSRIWKFLEEIEKKGFLFSKTQTILSKEEATAEKDISQELLTELYHLDNEKILRYDLTIPWKLELKDKTNLPKVIKRYQMGQVFRKGPRKGSRYRNFTQLDLEICSKEGYRTNELLELIFYFFKPEIELNQLRFEYNDYSRITELTYLEKQEIDKYTKTKIISKETFEKYQKITNKLENNTPDYLKNNFSFFNTGLMRGQGIYEGIVFEGYINNNRSSIVAGGEYKISEYYCTGISIGVEQVLDNERTRDLI
jgi:histidyl-tRNA synthetase